MFSTTFYFSRPIQRNQLPYLQREETLDDRVAQFTGNFFHHRLAIFLHRVEQLHDLRVEKCVLKGSVVPIVLGLAQEPPEGLNDIDLQITFAKKTHGQIDPQTILAVHKMSLEWLQLNTEARRPLCRPHLGYTNMQVRNPSGARNTPIDISLNFPQPNATPSPGAISTKDGLEIAVHYASNGGISFDISQTPCISEFCSLKHSLGLYKQHLFTVTPEHMAQIRNGLLILLRYEMKEWIFVTPVKPEDPENAAYIKGDMEALKRLCLTAFIEQYRNDLDNMKLASALQNFISNHMPRHTKDGVLFLDELVELILNMAREPNSDLTVLNKMFMNIASCAHYSQTMDHYDPELKRFKHKLESDMNSLASLHEKRKSLAAPELKVPAPFQPESEVEGKGEEEDVENENVQQKVSRHPLHAITTLPLFVEKVATFDQISLEDQTHCLIRLLYKSCAKNHKIAFQNTLETEVSRFLSRLQESGSQTLALDLAVAFINFAEHPSALNTSSASRLIAQHMLQLLLQSSGKKGKQLNKLVCFYQALPPPFKRESLGTLCVQYLEAKCPVLGEHKAKLLLRWIQAHEGIISPAMLEIVQACFRHVTESQQIAFVDKIASKISDVDAAALRPQNNNPALELLQIEPLVEAKQEALPSAETRSPDHVTLQKIQILLKHAHSLRQSKKWVKALEQYTKIENLLSAASLELQTDKRIGMILEKAQKAVTEPMIEEVAKKARTHPQEALTLFKEYWPNGGDRLSTHTYMIFAMEYALKGNYYLSFLHHLKVLRAILHSQAIDPITGLFRYPNKGEFYRVLIDVHSYLQLLDRVIQNTPSVPSPLKAHVHHLQQTFSAENLEKILVSQNDGFSIYIATEDFESMEVPIDLANDPQHDILVPLATLYTQCQSYTIQNAITANARHFYQALFNNFPSDETFALSLKAIENFSQAAAEENAERVVSNYLELNSQERIVRLQPLSVHMPLSNYFVSEASRSKDNESKYLFASLAYLHAFTVLKKSREHRQAITKKEIKMAEHILGQCSNLQNDFKQNYPILEKKWNQLCAEMKNIRMEPLPISYALISELEQLLLRTFTKPLVPKIDEEKVVQVADVLSEVPQLIEQKNWINALKAISKFESSLTPLPPHHPLLKKHKPVIAKHRQTIYNSLSLQDYLNLLKANLIDEAMRYLDFLDKKAASEPDPMQKSRMKTALTQRRIDLNNHIQKMINS